MHIEKKRRMHQSSLMLLWNYLILYVATFREGAKWNKSNLHKNIYYEIRSFLVTKTSLNKRICQRKINFLILIIY